MTYQVTVKHLLCLCILLIIGCTNYQEKKTMENFDTIARSYELSITWSEFDAAATHTKSEAAEDEMPDFEKLKMIQVSRYKVKKVALSEDKNQIVQIVEIQYFRKDQMIVQTLQDKQLWEYDDQAKRWLLTSGLPKFK